MQFSTPDEDKDNAPGGSCAAMRSTGWWFNACTSANLNEVAPMWPSTTAAPYFFLPARYSEMKIRKFPARVVN